MESTERLIDDVFLNITQNYSLYEIHGPAENAQGQKRQKGIEIHILRIFMTKGVEID